MQALPEVLPLQKQNEPTSRDLVKRIDAWIIHHLLSTARSHPHYENYLYGPVNALLGSIFPLERRYMVIPQALVRKPLSEEEIGRNPDKLSFGSTGGVHESRDIAGVERQKQFPDFVIVKVTPQPRQERHHQIMTLVEVKREISLMTAESKDHLQVVRYMTRAAELPNVNFPLLGYLIQADRVYKYEATEEHISSNDILIAVKRVGGPTIMTGRNDDYIHELCELSSRYWNFEALTRNIMGATSTQAHLFK